MGLMRWSDVAMFCMGALVFGFAMALDGIVAVHPFVPFVGLIVWTGLFAGLRFGEEGGVDG